MKGDSPTADPAVPSCHSSCRAQDENHSRRHGRAAWPRRKSGRPRGRKGARRATFRSRHDVRRTSAAAADPGSMWVGAGTAVVPTTEMLPKGPRRYPERRHSRGHFGGVRILGKESKDGPAFGVRDGITGKYGRTVFSIQEISRPPLVDPRLGRLSVWYWCTGVNALNRFAETWPIWVSEDQCRLGGPGPTPPQDRGRAASANRVKSRPSCLTSRPIGEDREKSERQAGSRRASSAFLGSAQR